MLCIVMSVYLVAKAVLNMVIGGGFSLVDLVIALALAGAIISGIKFLNYAAAAVLVAIAVIHLPDNISNIGSNWMYLIEGILDIGCGAVLCLQSDVKEYFTNTINKN